jgi:hypothetical protein
MVIRDKCKELLDFNTERPLATSTVWQWMRLLGCIYCAEKNRFILIAKREPSRGFFGKEVGAGYCRVLIAY